MIASARMYSVNAPVARSWRVLLEWVVARAGVACEVIDYPPPQPLSGLWTRSDLGCAFMCGYPLAQAAPMPTILAAPVPSLAAYRHAPVYWTDIVVRAESPFLRLDDIFGGRFAFTTEDSQSGYQAPRAFLARHAKARGGTLFAATVGPLVTPRGVIEAVLNDEADAGPVDSYAHDLIRAHEPQLAARLRTIARTAATPIPPFIAASGIAADDAARLQTALLAVAQAGELGPQRTLLLLEGFVAMRAQDYAGLLDNARTADTLGYPRLV